MLMQNKNLVVISYTSAAGLSSTDCKIVALGVEGFIVSINKPTI